MEVYFGLSPCLMHYLLYVTLNYIPLAAAVAQWVRAFAQLTEGWVFESQPRQTYIIKTGSDSSTAKRSALGLNVMGPRR